MPQLKRREVRIKVMQVLYAHEISKEPISKIKKDLMPDFDYDQYEKRQEIVDKGYKKL